MKILIVTQKVDQNDSYFGFFYDWILHFAQNCQNVTVLSLEVNNSNFPSNVKIITLGKEKFTQKNNVNILPFWLKIYTKFIYIISFYYHIWSERKSYNAVFTHMSPWYLILGFPIWKFLNYKTGLWYTHRKVDLKLRLAEKCADLIFTASPDSFRINSKKVNYFGHAIEINHFFFFFNLAIKNDQTYSANNPNKIGGSTIRKGAFRIITVGRITQIKNLKLLVLAITKLQSENFDVQATIVGEAVRISDLQYKKELIELISKNKMQEKIKLIGPIPNKDIAQYYWEHDASINLCPTGGLDKVVLESMASQTPVIVSNKAFVPYLVPYQNTLLFKEGDVDDLVQKIKILAHSDLKQITDTLFKSVCEKSNLGALISKIVSKY